MIENKADPSWGARGNHHHSRQPVASVLRERSRVKQIAVHVAKEGAGLDRLELAIHLAKALDAGIVGVGSLYDRKPSISELGGADIGPLITPFSENFPRGSQALDIASAETADRADDAAEEAFWQRVNLCSSTVHEWRMIAQGGLAQMVAIAKVADLVILGQFASKDALGAPGFAPEDVAAASGRPVLIVPDMTPAPKVGANIIIAWDGSRGVARAVYDAMPLMRDAKRITLLHVNNSQHAEDPGADAAALYLERHGFQTFVEGRDSAEASIPDVILTCAAAAGADLLVAGLSLHSKIHATLFGSVAHELLRHTTIPILVSC